MARDLYAPSFLVWLLSQAMLARGLTFTVPSSPPSNASAKLSAAPIGVSWVSSFVFEQIT